MKDPVSASFFSAPPPEALPLFTGFSLSHFGGVREPIDVPLVAHDGMPLITFLQGPTASGKSTAVRALQTMLALLRTAQFRAYPSGGSARLNVQHQVPSDVPFPACLSERATHPSVFKLTMDGGGGFRWQVAQGQWSVSTHGIDQARLDDLTRAMQEGKGPTVLDLLHRRPTGLVATLLEDFYALDASRDLSKRRSWRHIQHMVSHLGSLRGTSLQLSHDGKPELLVEKHDQFLVPFGQLAWGEQRLLSLLLVISISSASVLALDEHGLDRGQRLVLRAALEAAVRAGQFRQVLIESQEPVDEEKAHVVVFDRRPEGMISARVRPVDYRNLAMLDALEGQEVKAQWVNERGFTVLPESMRDDLGCRGGGEVWFLKGNDGRWGAYTGAEVDTWWNGKTPAEQAPTVPASPPPSRPAVMPPAPPAPSTNEAPDVGEGLSPTSKPAPSTASISPPSPDADTFREE